MDSIISICSPLSMLSHERLQNNIDAIAAIERDRIEGDVVEIGVWKGGSMLAMMKAHEYLKTSPRNFYLYDTFEGMTPEGPHDVDFRGRSATSQLHHPEIHCTVRLDEVKHVIQTNCSISDTQIHYQVGDIMNNTIIPERIACLRLDTDWYESTRHELETFYPKVVSGGWVMIDDYGHWLGCKRAVDEFLTLHPNIKLIPIDYTGVYFVKP